MTARLAADTVVALHFAFIAFVIAGGLLTFKHRAWAIVHLPAVAWAAWTEFTATVCPLTPWENVFRAEAGDAGIHRKLRRALHRAAHLPGKGSRRRRKWASASGSSRSTRPSTRWHGENRGARRMSGEKFRRST
jgi:hypothetical protein